MTEKIDHLKAHREKVAQQKIDGTYVAPVYKNPVEKNVGNTTSYKKAVSAMCASCMGCTEGHQEPNWKEEVRDCTAKSCPLYLFRPYKDKGPDAGDSDE